VEGAQLVLSSNGEEQRVGLVSLAEAGAWLGPDLLPEGVPEDSTPLEIDSEGAERLADFYAFNAGVLERFRTSLPAAAEASEINLWPEHFDIAFEAGPEEAGQRANYGASPGDQDHSEPYLYVGPWTARPEGELWNARAFPGAELSYSELLEAGDQAGAALDFLRIRFDALSS
jgi:hypothetical protein